MTVSVRPSFARKPLLLWSRRSSRVALETWQFPQPRGLYEYSSAQFFISRRLAQGLEHVDQQPFLVPQIADAHSWCLSGSKETTSCTSSKLEHRRVHPFGVTAHYSGSLCDITRLTPRSLAFSKVGGIPDVLLNLLLDHNLVHLSRIALVKQSQHFRAICEDRDKADRRQF